MILIVYLKSTKNQLKVNTIKLKKLYLYCHYYNIKKTSLLKITFSLLKAY